MMLPERIKYDVHIYSYSGIEPATVDLSAEYSFLLKINGSPFVSIACSGSGLEDLAAGHLITEGIIKKRDEIIDISVDEASRSMNVATVMSDELLERLFKIRSLASACGQGRSSTGDEGLGMIEPGNSVSGRIIISSMKSFLHLSDLHRDTRGVHSAALYDFNGNLVLFVDEIGRHNAVDKIIGHCFQNGISLSDKMIFSTGRLSSEIVYKALYASAPVLVSKAYPTSLSIDLAKKHGLILIANVTAAKFYIFNRPEAVTK